MNKAPFNHLHFVFCALAILIGLGSFAQEKGTIRGHVYEKENLVEFVSVILYAASDTTKVLAITVTDSTGEYTIQNISFATYLLKFQLVGYIGTGIKITLKQHQKVLKGNGTFGLVVSDVFNTQRTGITAATPDFIL